METSNTRFKYKFVYHIIYYKLCTTNIEMIIHNKIAVHDRHETCKKILAKVMYALRSVCHRCLG